MEQTPITYPVFLEHWVKIIEGYISDFRSGKYILDTTKILADIVRDGISDDGRYIKSRDTGKREINIKFHVKEI